jgi:cobyrinic acid a,c-diamide synthase
LNIPRLVIAGTTSDVGKTSITCGIIHGIKKRGYTVQPFKVGPDYIDPTYLTEISGNETRNLDSWLMGKAGLLNSFKKNSHSDMAIIEGVMGFYDGFSGQSNFSSTHHVATLLKTPVILVLDASKTARSIAATALGFKKFHKNSRIVAVILNKVGSRKHEVLCRQALKTVKIPILGAIPNNPSFSLVSRHLGLIPIIEKNSLKKKIHTLAAKISDFLNIEDLINISRKASFLPSIIPSKTIKKKISIAVALDNSFNFYYKDNLDALQREGAEIKFFSPLSNSKLPFLDGLFIGGGFPEVLASSLEKNEVMRHKIKKAAENNVPLYAECGGLMYLTNSIHDGNKKFRMVGLFDAETIMTKKMTLNYTKGKIKSDCIISKTSGILHGHEFHYSELNLLSSDSKFAYELTIGQGIKKKKDGLKEYNTLASYGHLYFDNGNYAKNFVQNCIKYSRR